MELICPKCDARYQIPDGSIGSAGRQVSCMSCSHAWHAYPPLVLDTQSAPAEPAASPQAPEPAPPSEPPTGGGGLLSSDWDTDPPSGGAPPPASSHDGGGGGGLLSSDYESDPPGHMRQRHVAEDEPSGPVMHGGPVGGGRPRGGGQALTLHDSNDAGGARPAPPPQAPPPQAPPAEQPAAAPAAMSGAERLEKSRTDQMAEIRAMLADVQASEKPAEPTPDEASAAPAATRNDPEPTAPLPGSSPVMQEYHQSVDEQAENNGDDALRKRLMSTAMKTATNETDVKNLRKKHLKKERKRKHQKAAGSGAFLTGFLFIVMVAAGMAAMYLLAPQIVERAPETSNAMAQYVATVDTLKVQVIDFFEGMRSWVIERADPERAADN